MQTSKVTAIDSLVIDASNESIAVMAEVYANRIEDADRRIQCTDNIVIQGSIRSWPLILLTVASTPTLAQWMC